MKITLSFLVFLVSLALYAQVDSTNYQTKKMAVADSIKVDSVSINSSRFLLYTKDRQLIDTSFYSIDFQKALLRFKKPITTDSVIVEYLRFPDFLTKRYSLLDKSIIVEDTKDLDKLLRLSRPNTERQFTPFDGLTTSGSISRGVTIGNNQNSVLNSELDLQITGKLNEKVSLRASIQDANIPLQESGYSQRLDEFDQVFIELFSDRWNIRAGDIDLVNRDAYFARFTKRVQGLSVQAHLGDLEQPNRIFASGALVRGQFARSQFIAQEGNQGPYKLQGANGELFVLIVSGSESVYVNGVLVERGENQDYIIDYNAGEILFNATFPITSEMRITVDYQFSDRNFSRFVAYGGGNYKSDKLQINASVYSENDAKNQPLQQNLSEAQVAILANAGDDQSQMVAPSEVPESFNENRILYKKEIIDGVEAFVFSNDPNDTLFSVRFTLVGDNQGNYVVSSTNAISSIFEYVPPVNGIPQGNYEPIVQLIAPTKLQLAVINGSYNPSDKTAINFELAGSKNDLNLFSDLDDGNNDGFAGKLQLVQSIVKSDSLWSLNAHGNIDFIHQDFRTIERLYNAEFNRDWNLENPMGNQQFIIGGLSIQHPKKGIANYQFENLNFSENFNGNRHVLSANLRLKNLLINSNSSLLKASSSTSNSTFLRSENSIVYKYNKGWAGTRIELEDNEQRTKSNDSLTPISQRFLSYDLFKGFGDSTNVFVEVGFKNRRNDSIRSNRIERVNTSNTYYLNSRLLKNDATNLSLYVNYRQLNNKATEDETSLNSRLQYSQKLFKQLLQLNTVYETNSGTLPQQEFTYVQVEPGQGAYTWIDYNGNGIQELEEFEIAEFQDQGSYIRVLLPNQVFIKTHQNKLSQTLTINPKQFYNNTDKEPGVWAQFYNQSSYLIDRKIRRNGNNFNLNPFDSDAENQLGLQLNFRNTLFFNRGLQRYTMAYTYLTNKARSVLSVGFVENNIKSHQLDFTHKIANTWLVTVQSALEQSESESENFSSKNFNIDAVRFNPKLSYLFNENARFDIFYQYSNQDNTIGNMESLQQQKYGLSFAFSPKKKGQQASVTGEFNYFSNDFNGNANSPVGYQMMRGLQPGKNFTWSLIAQKKLTKFLDLNLNYFGRKSETSKVIHTGNIQLRAYF